MQPTSQPSAGLHSRFPYWLRLTIGLTTLLALLALTLALISGLRDGQHQRESQRRQQIAIHLQQAADLVAEGNPRGALQSYRQVLLLDPENADADAGISALLDPVATPTATPLAAAVVAPIPEPPATPLNPLEVVWADAQSLYEDGRWQEAIDRLRQVRAIQAEFEAARVSEMLYTAYASLGTEKSNAGSLEEAVGLFDRALEIRPEAAEIQTMRNVTAQYVDALTYWHADWPRAIELLQRLYDQNPGYRDVRQRLHEAHLNYGDNLARTGDWCGAVDAYTAAIAVQNAPGLPQKQTEFQTLCSESGGTATRPESLTPQPGAPAPAVISGEGTGRILYSSVDPVDGRYRIYAQPVTANVRPVALVDDGMQPDLRADGRRIAFRSTRGDMGGLGGFDPATGLRIRFSTYVEDSLPSWNPEGNRIVFASDREGDRRWRLYVTWADGKGVAEFLDFGMDPDWHPSADRIAYRGCDATGNRCGIWSMSSSAADRQPLTNDSSDARPSWSPDGRVVVFMNSNRHGNWEVYQVAVESGQVTRLTDSPANDGLPAVSPDGNQVAFVSDRDGSWKIWVVPLGGGTARLLAPITGNLGNWIEQDLQWVR